MESVVLLYTTSGKLNVTGNKQKGAGYANFLGGSHTVSISTTNFVGRVYIEASIATNPQDNDWFAVPLRDNLSYVQFPLNPNKPTGDGYYNGDTGTVAFTFIGNYVWVRARIDREYLNPAPVDPWIFGSVDQILLNYGTLGASNGSLRITGPIGPVGPQGIPGIAVNTGPTGPDGLGVTGPTGAIGQTGPSGSSVVDASDIPPSSPVTGMLWWNSTDGNEYIYYNNSWVPTTIVPSPPSTVVDPGISYSGVLSGNGFPWQVLPQSGMWKNGVFTSNGINSIEYIGGDEPGITSIDITANSLTGIFNSEFDSLLNFNWSSLIYMTSANFSIIANSLTSINLSGLTIINSSSLFYPTMNALTTLNISALGSIYGEFAPVMNALTSLNISSLTHLGNYSLFSPVMNSLTTLNLSSLLSIENNSQFQPTMNALTTLDLSSLTSIGNNCGFSPILHSLQILNFPSVVSTGSNCYMTIDGPSLLTVNFNSLIHMYPGTDINLSSCQNLSTLAFPSLTTIDSDSANNTHIAINGCQVTSLIFTSLVNVGQNFYLILGNPAVITTLEFPSLQTCLSDLTSGFSGNQTNLTTFSFGPNLLRYDGNVNISFAALNQASVDGILVSLSLLNGSNGTTLYTGWVINLSGGTSSPPSSMGLAAKAILESNGNIVVTN